ncbi:hypothetical protein BDV41DRAFT_211464 [Aspergillus transmontanensis]|uniref:BZIP domain-containing protein n=1 Tax=Aspergillus transmontanensis TaxID=1034304 RepID=A0A5N6W244_9EURO|nr:hypothetical protein BDV41DRAFT_211464 [Aspergillus transmontanensis]
MSTSGNQRTATKVDRKRITDRKAQRNHRERVKAYISHLETTVEELTKASQEGSERSLLQKLQEKQLEIERLKGAIRQANTALRTALDTTSASISPSIAERVPEDSPVMQNNSPSVAEHATTQRLNNCKMQMEPTLEPEDLSLNMSRASQFRNNNKRKYFAAPYSNLACGDGQMNYFQVLNESLIHVLSGGPLTTSAADDDDLTIRAILHGWDTIKEEKPLDRGWKFLRALDQGLFHRTGPVERLAILRLMRSMLMSKNGSPGHSTGQVPSFMFPTTMQTLVAHACIIDFFVWPNLRDHLIASETCHTSEAAAAHYAAEIQLSWPYQVRDAYRYHEEEGKFQFSIEFNNTYYDLKSWKFRSNPALKMLVANGPMSLLEGRLQASSSILISSLDPNGIIESEGVVGY